MGRLWRASPALPGRPGRGRSPYPDELNHGHHVAEVEGVVHLRAESGSHLFAVAGVAGFAAPRLEAVACPPGELAAYLRTPAPLLSRWEHDACPIPARH